MIRLHVVYAGRGDAMIVQDEANLYIVDGGPQGYVSGAVSGAPYYRYFMSALRAVADEMHRPADRVAPNAVVVSHAHEDHFGGIAAIFERFLSSTYNTNPTPQKPLVFNGPFVTQIMKVGLDVEEGTLKGLLDAFNFTPEPIRPQVSPLFNSFQLAENGPVGYSVYKRNASHTLGRDWSVDTSPANLASVLMYHRASKMVLTGDNAGYLIAPFVEACVHGLADESVSILKVPHHGSMRNSQRGQPFGAIPALVWKEYSLLCFGASPAQWKQIRMPRPLQHPGEVAAARDTLEAVADEEGVDTDDLVAALLAAFAKTMSNIENGISPPFVPVNQATFRTERIWPALIDRLYAQSLATGRGNTGAAPRTTKRSRDARLDPLSPSWFNKLTEKRFSEVFLAAIALKQLKLFFTAVNAKNHVISADSSYRHPTPETLAAIAASAADANKKVCVFVTDGYSVDLDRLNELRPTWATSMAVRYLNRGARIVLDISAPANANNPALLDPLKTTAPLQAGFTRAQLHTQFQSNRGALIPGRTLIDDKFQFQVSGQNAYLNLAAKGAISISPNTQSFNIDEAWTLQLTNAGAAPFPDSFDDIRLRVAGAGAPPPTRLLRLVVPPPGGLLGSVLQVPAAFGQPAAYISTNAANKFLTQNINAAAVFTISKLAAVSARTPLGLAAADPRRALAQTTAPVTLRAFCQTVGVSTAQPLSCAQALPQLVGPAAAAQLAAQLTLHVIERVYGWSADLDRSTVEYTVDERGPLVSGANIAIVLATPLTFTLEDQQQTIATATATLTRDASSEALALAVNITTTSGVTVAQQAKLAEPTRTRPLDQYLNELAVPAASWPNVTLGTLLSALVGAEANAEDLLLRTPSFIAAAGIAEWQLEHSASEVETQQTHAGNTEVALARIAAQLPNPIKATIEGIALSITAVVLEVSDARLPTMEASLQATATVGSTTLAASCVLTAETSSLELSLPGSATLAELVALLPGSPNLGALSVPLANQALSALSFSAPGIVLRQPSLGAEPYELAEVYGTVSFSGWQSVLPAGWPAPSNSSLSVRVLHPLDAEQRQIALAVVFDIAVAAKTLSVELAAEPLPEPTPVWAYTLAVRSDPTVAPCSISEVLGAVGLGVPLQSLAGTLPAVGEVSSKLALCELEITLEVPSTGASTVGSFTIGLITLESWEILPQLLSLDVVQVDLSYEAGAWSGGAGAEAELGGAYTVAAAVELPTSTTAGSISFTSDSSKLTLAVLVQLCGLGDLTKVPVLGTLLSVAVTDIELLLVYPTGATHPALAAVSFTLQAGEQALGWLKLSSLALTVDRRLLGAGGKPEPATSFWLEGEWDATKIASLNYDGVKEELAGELRMTGPETIAELLGELLGPSTANALLPLIGQFKVREGSFALNTAASFALLSFSLRLDTSASLKLAGATIAELAVSYTAAKAQTPASYELLGTITGAGTEAKIAIACQAGKDGTVSAAIESVPSTSGLTARGLLALLGLTAPPVLEPAGVPKFFDLKLTHAAATFTVASTLQLDTLNVSVLSSATLPLLASPAVTLTGLALEVDYDSKATPTTSGFITGQLQVGSALVTVKYVKGEDGEPEFQASLEPASADTPDFATLIASGAYDPGYGLPTGLGIPAHIPMARLTAVARPEKFIEISGYKDATAWPVAVGSLTIDVNALGGRVKVQAPAQQGAAATYEAALFGQLTFNGFLATSALFTFGSGATHSVLSAAATSGQSAIQLPAVAGALGAPWSDVIPAGTEPIAFGSAAYVYVDLTSGLFALYGQLAKLGTAALLSVTRNGQRSYVFVCGLAQPFQFASMWPALAPVDGYLAVTAANAAVLAYNGTLAELLADLSTVSQCAQLQGITFETPFTDLPALRSELAPTTPLPQGFALFAALELKSGKLTQALGKVLESPTTAPSLLLWATINHTTPANTTYAAELNDLVLLGGHLTLDGSATYTPNAAETLVVDAHIGVTLSPRGAPYTFHGTLTLAPEKTTFLLTGSDQPAQIAEPFGAMFGVTITSPKLAVEYAYPASQPTSSTISISGTVTLTIAAKAVALTAGVYFHDGVPVLAAVALSGEMSVLDLFADIITGAHWPSGYAPIVLLSGSMYYANIQQPSIELEGKTYLQGYHVACEVAIFGAHFHVDVGVDSTGVLVSGAYVGSIDLVIVQLTPYTDAHSKQLTQGPTVAIDTRTVGGTVYEIATGISVFGKPFLSTSFSYQPALAKYAGKATYEGEIAGVNKPSVSFTYSETEGLRIVDWPLAPVLEQALNYADMLQKASEGTPCGELVGLAFDKAIKTSFSLELKQEGEITGGALPLVLTGTYTVTVLGSQLFTLELPKLKCSIKAPNSFELASIAAWVATTLVENAASIGASLLSDSVNGEKALKILIAEFTVTSFAPQLLTNLICREADAPNVRSATETTIDKQVDQIEDPATGELPAVTDAAATATNAASLAAAADALADAVVALGVLGATVATLVALIDKAWAWLSKAHRESKEKAEKDHDTGKTAVETARARIVGLLAMRGAPAGAFTSEPVVEVSFTSANLPAQSGIDYHNYENFTYEVQVAGDAKFANVLGTAVTSGLSATVHVAPSVEEAWVRVRAIYKPATHETFEGAWIEAGPCHKHKPTPPTNLQLTYAAAALHASWDTQTASHYNVDLRLLDGNVEVVKVEPTAPPVAFGPATHVPLTPGAGYTVSVCAVFGTSVGPPASATANVPTLLQIVKADWKAQSPAATAATDALALLPSAGPAQLFYTLLAAGYPMAPIRAAVKAALPNTTEQQLNAIVDALTDTSAVARLLLGEGVAGATIVNLCAGIYHPVPVELAIALKLAATPEAGLAAGFVAAFSVTLAEANALLACVYTDASGNTLAVQLHAAGVPRADATSAVAECWPALTPQQVAAAITAAYGPPT